MTGSRESLITKDGGEHGPAGWHGRPRQHSTDRQGNAHKRFKPVRQILMPTFVSEG
jgi:hypothetical protein